MRNWLFAALGVAVVISAVTASYFAARVVGAGPNDVKQVVKLQDEGVKQAQLPLSQVVLFNSGVGYFQREGTVVDDARVDLTFDVRDINDLLKSMVLRDLDKGHITAVSYDSNAPIERTLKSFAVDLTGNPTLSDIVGAARGEKVEVTLVAPQGGQGATATGTIIGIEKQKSVPTGAKDAVDVAVLNLWCTDGIKSFKLPEIQRLRFLNPTIESEFKKALETLALSHDTQKKAVSIRCAGEGKRRVVVSYVVENPIWKTSYRLVLGTKEVEKPFLQSWAVVENPSDEDWRDVRMMLVSGRPLSFQMDLYTPLYVQRPTARLELFQSLRPVAYSGSMEEDKKRQFAGGGPPPAPARDMQWGAAPRPEDRARRASDAKGEAATYYARELQEQMRKQMDLGSSVTAAATAAKLGDFFNYAIDKPVTLPRQKSAMLPILGKDVKADRVSIYRESVQKKFPLLGLRMKNTSGAHLMQGPITIFEGSNYAGDAQIQDLQPDEERLLSYAIDLGTEVDPVPSHESGRILAIKAVKGVVQTTVKNRQVKTYTIKNRNDVERTVLVEHPVNHTFKLVGEKPTETASDFYRFSVTVPAGKDKVLVVAEEREDVNNFVINIQGSDDPIRILINQPLASKELKAALASALKLREALHKTQREIAEMERQLNAVLAENLRVRGNMKETPTDTDLHKRYIKKLDEQETQIEKLRADIKKAQTAEHEQKKSFEDFVANLSVP